MHCSSTQKKDMNIVQWQMHNNIKERLQKETYSCIAN